MGTYHGRQKTVLRGITWNSTGMIPVVELLSGGCVRKSRVKVYSMGH